MTFYSIKDLERISSTKAHTIRIWEQRYSLLEPERTGTNIRVYNDEQLKKLLNVCTLLNKGLKISTISKMSKAQFSDEINQIIASSSQDDVQLEAMINQALVAIAAYDTVLFDEMFSTAVKKFGLKKTYEWIVYPMLVRTGLMWIKDDLLPAQEHFLSNLIRQKLFAAIDSLPLPADPDQTWVLFLNEREDHEIGLLFANYMIRQHGKKVVYLGCRVPYGDLSSVVKQVAPTHIYSFFTSPTESDAVSIPGSLAVDFTNVHICISGRHGNINAGPEEGRIIRIETIDQLIEILNQDYAA